MPSRPTLYIPAPSRPSLACRAVWFAGKLGQAVALWACLGAFAIGLASALSGL